MKAIDPAVQPRTSTASSLAEQRPDLPRPRGAPVAQQLHHRQARDVGARHHPHRRAPRDIADRAAAARRAARDGASRAGASRRAVRAGASRAGTRAARHPRAEPEILDTAIMEPAVLDGLTRAGEYEHEDPDVDPRSARWARNHGVQRARRGVTARFAGDDSEHRADGHRLELRPAASRATPMSAPAQPADTPDDALLDFAMPEPSEPLPRPSLSDLPLVAEEVVEEPPREPTPAASAEPIEEDEPSIGGDLPFIMPEPFEAAPSASPELDDIPLMDLSLPAPGEAMASIAGTPEPATPDDRLPRARGLRDAGAGQRGHGRSEHRAARRRDAVRRDADTGRGAATPHDRGRTHGRDAQGARRRTTRRLLQAPAARRGDARVGATATTVCASSRRR